MTDRIVGRTTARQRRTFHLCLLIVWAGPGAVVSWLLRDSVAWITWLSWYAIVVSHLAGFSAETPAEVEGG